jgi:hypothetical protein
MKLYKAKFDWIVNGSYHQTLSVFVIAETEESAKAKIGSRFTTKFESVENTEIELVDSVVVV